MRVSVGWKWKVGAYRRKTGCSTCKSSPQVASDERLTRSTTKFGGVWGHLVGVGLADITPTALSSVYFFHDPAWRPQSPGVFSILQQLAYAQRHGLRYHYLGYWIAGCPSMAYKAQYRPHELLVGYPPDDVEPTWIAR